MTDQELLGLAAKACGLPLSSEWDCAAEGILIGTGAGDLEVWSPLIDDGDALRLAVKLGIDLTHHLRRAFVHAQAEYRTAADEDYGSDPYAATRRAIVRAAAKIGKEAS